MIIEMANLRVSVKLMQCLKWTKEGGGAHLPVVVWGNAAAAIFCWKSLHAYIMLVILIIYTLNCLLSLFWRGGSPPLWNCTRLLLNLVLLKKLKCAKIKTHMHIHYLKNFPRAIPRDPSYKWKGMKGGWSDGREEKSTLYRHINRKLTVCSPCRFHPIMTLVQESI
jgi:hypothetical protein